MPSDTTSPPSLLGVTLLDARADPAITPESDPVVQLARKLLGTPEEQAQRRARRQAEAEKAEREILAEGAHAQLCVEQDAKHEGWDIPVPFHEFDLPAFPVDAFTDWLRDFVEAEATATQTPVDLAGMLGLTTCAVPCAKQMQVQVKPGWVEPTNLFMAAALSPGNRKTPVFRDTTAPLEEHEKAEALRLGPEIAEAQSRYRIAEQSLLKAQADASKAKPEERDAKIREASDRARELASMRIPALPRLLADDCTPEKLGALLQDQGGRIAVLSAEGGVFEQMAGRYSANGTPNLDIYLKGHAGDSHRVDRVGRPSECVLAPALTLGLAVQPEVLRGLMDKPGFRGRGLLGRFLYSLPRSPLGFRAIDPPPMPPEIREAYRQGILALLALPAGTDAEGNPQPHTLTLTPDALAELQGFQAWIEPQLAPDGNLGTMADWAGKLVGAVARLAGILHAAEHVTAGAPWEIPVSRETLLRARCLADYLIPHAQAAYAEMGANPDVDAAQHLLRWIQKTGCASFTKRDAYQGTKGRFRQVRAMEPGLSLLAEHSFVRRRVEGERSGPGRPASPIYDVNPLLQNGGSEDSGNSETVEGGP